MTISGNAAPGYSSGEAMAEMERLAEQLPEGFAYEWTGISYEEQQAAGEATMLMGLSLLVVFLLLAALYENWGIPLSVLLIVPIGVFGALLAAWLRGLPLDISLDRKSTRLNSSHSCAYRMPSSACTK